MGNRVTVMRMLRNRLAEAKSSYKHSFEYEDLVNVLGGDNSKEPQHRVNMKTDIEQLEFLIEKLTEYCNIRPIELSANGTPMRHS